MSRNPILGSNVPNLTAPASALTPGAAPTGSVWRAVVFPLAGGAQLIDALGNVTNIAGSSSGAALLAADNVFTGHNSFNPTASTSGVPDPAVTITSNTDTAITATQESPTVLIDLAAARAWAAGVVPVQRSVYVTAPVFNGPGTIDDAFTVAIEGPPSGTAATGNVFAFGVLSGISSFDEVTIDATLTLNNGLVIDASIANPTITNPRTNEGMRFVANGTGTIALNVGAGGSVQIGGLGVGAKVGFYGHATIAQQTGIAVDIAAVHGALVALGLITA